MSENRIEQIWGLKRCYSREYVQTSRACPVTGFHSCHLLSLVLDICPKRRGPGTYASHSPRASSPHGSSSCSTSFTWRSPGITKGKARLAFPGTSRAAQSQEMAAGSRNGVKRCLQSNSSAINDYVRAGWTQKPFEQDDPNDDVRFEFVAMEKVVRPKQQWDFTFLANMLELLIYRTK